MVASEPKAKQRFLALDVEEVSLVGSPANTEKFITKKSLEQEPPVAKANPADFIAAIAQLGLIKDTVATLKSLKSLQDGKPNNTDGDKPYTQESMLSKLKSLCDDKTMPPMIAEALKGLYDKMGKSPAGKPVMKSVGDGVGDPQVELIHSLLMTALNTIQKVSMLVDMEMPDLDELLAKVAVQKDIQGLFTGERVAQLKSAMGMISSFLKELSPGNADLGMSVYAAAAAAEPKGGGADGASGTPAKPATPTTTPSGNQPIEPAGPAQGQPSAISNDGVAAAVKKAVDDAMGPINTALTEAKTKLTETETKLAAVTKQLENVRGTSKELPETGMEGKPVQKSTSLFAGIV